MSKLDPAVIQYLDAIQESSSTILFVTTSLYLMQAECEGEEIPESHLWSGIGIIRKEAEKINKGRPKGPSLSVV